MRALDSFQGIHSGEKIVVCGCGVSLKDLEQPQQFLTIGVNDVGRLFHPKYLVVVDPKERFKDDRFHYVETSQSEYLFTQRTDLDLSRANIVSFRLGKKEGTDFHDPNVLHYGVVSPYVALYLAAYMGATRIGLIGVDFTDHHFFGNTGTHAWTSKLADVDSQFGRLGDALLARGIQVFNLSHASRLTAFPKMTPAAFAALPAQQTFAPRRQSVSVGVSAIVVSLNEGEFLRHTVDSLAASLPGDGEIIVVDDGSGDGSADFLAAGYDHVTLLRPTGRLGTARARNFGAQHARGKILTFCDAHVAVPPDWSGQLLASLNNPDVGAVAPAIRGMRYPDDYLSMNNSAEAKGYGLRWRDAGLNVDWLGSKSQEPYPAPLLGAAFLAMRRNLFAAIGGFDSGFALWGSDDAELSIRLWTLGYECLVVPGIEVAHRFRSERPYRVGWEAVLYNKLRLATIHFGPSRIQCVTERLKQNGGFPAALARLGSSDVESRRSQIQALRRYDDDWFFQKFRHELSSELADIDQDAKTLEPLVV